MQADYKTQSIHKIKKIVLLKTILLFNQGQCCLHLLY